MAPGLNFDVSPTTLAIAGVALFAFYYYTVEQGQDLLDDFVEDPLSAAYKDWLQPLSPRSIGKNLKDFGKWLT